MTNSNSANDLNSSIPPSSRPILVADDPSISNLEQRKNSLKRKLYLRHPKSRFFTRLVFIFEEAFLEPFTTPLGKFLAFGYICLLAIALLLVSVSFVFSNLLGPSQLMQVVELEPNTITFLNKCFNLILYAFPAFIIASLGSATRLLLSDSGLGIRKSVKLLFGSGCFGILAFLSMESGVIVEFLTNAYTIQSADSTPNESKGFYKIVLVCFMTGMFSTIIFITIDEKVKLVSSKMLSK